jgi:serine/threonine protein kinase
LSYQQLFSYVDFLAESVLQVDPCHIELHNDFFGDSKVSKYQLQTPTRTYLLRLFPESFSLAKKQQECILSELAAKLAIAPQCCYIDKRYNYILLEYFFSDCCQLQDLDNPHILQTLSYYLAKLHCAKVSNLSVITSLTQSLTYRINHIIQSPRLEEFFHQKQLYAVARYLDKLYLLQPQQIIHNDYHPFNILVNNDTVKIIDWTDAGLGSPYSDLAMFSIFLNNQQQEFFFEAYSSYTKTKINEAYLQQQLLGRLLLQMTWALYHASTLSVNNVSIIPQQVSEPMDISLLHRHILLGTEKLKTAQDFLDCANSLYTHFLHDSHINLGL